MTTSVISDSSSSSETRLIPAIIPAKQNLFVYMGDPQFNNINTRLSHMPDKNGFSQPLLSI